MRLLVVVQRAQDRERLRAGAARAHRLLTLTVSEAVEFLRAGRPVDVAIVDAHALGRLGSALRAARRGARLRGLAVLLLAAPGERLVRAQLGVTVDDLLRAPVDPLEVQARLRTLAALRRAAGARAGRRAAPRASGRLLPEALAASDVAAWVWDPARGRLTWGHVSDEARGGGATLRERLEHVHPTARDEVAEALRRAAGEGRPFQLDLRTDGGAKDHRWVEVRGRPLSDGSGQVAGVALDVTERRRAQEALVASEERFRALVEQSIEPVVLLDRGGRVRYASPGAGGLLREQPVGEPWTAGIHPDDVERGERTLGEVRTVAGRALTVTLRVARPDGSWAWVDCVLRNLLEHPHVGAIVVNARDVTARMEAEAALRVAELRQRRVAEVASDFAFTLRRDGTDGGLVLEWASEAFPRITGYALDDVAARGGFERVVWHPGDVHLWRRAARRVLAGESTVVEARAVRPDGATYWLRAYARPWREGAGGPVVGVYGAGQDVTERKRLEEERERLASIDDATSDFVALADTSARVFYLNRAAREALGLADSDDPGRLTLADCHVRWAADRLRDEAIPAALGTGRWFGTLAWLRADGREVPVSQVVLAHRGESGRVDFLAVVARDIQEHLDAEAALRRQAAQLEEQAHVLDLAHVLVRDPQGRVQRWTRGAEALYGWTAAEAAGRDVDALLATESPVPRAAIDAALEATGHWEGELVQRTRDGRRIVVASHWVVHRDPLGRALAVLEVSNDITPLKRLQTELAASREELRALSNHLQSALEEERTRIAREIHDELGQQLTGLKMDVAWIGSRLAKLDAPQARELVGKTTAMRELVDAAVQAVRRTATDLRPLVLDDLGLVAALEWLTQEFTGRTGIPCSFAADEPARRYERAVATALFRIAQEALTNVARHAGATRVSVSLHASDGRLVLEVADDGRGVARNGGRRERSLGVLGMQERARLLGGEVVVDSRAGEGTTVTARVPLDGGLGYSPSTSRMA